MKRIQFRLPWFIYLILAITIVARLLPGARTIDDSFITFRYARNILAGEGFVYNPGEPVMGTTTPLYTLLMVTLGSISGGVRAPFAILALLVNALADAFTVLLLWLIGRHWQQELAGIAAAAIWAVLPFSVTFAIGGLETSLYVLLLTACTYFYITRRVAMAAFAGSLALLTRPDALILLAPIALDHLLRIIRKDEKLRWLDLLALTLLPLLWYGFATVQFGSPIPHSVQAKLGAYRLEPGEGLIRLIQHYATPFMAQEWIGTWLAVASGMLIYPLLFFLGAFQVWKIDRRSLPFLLYPWLYLIVFAAANPLIFRWYLTPPLAAYILLILIGLKTLLADLFARLKIKRQPVQFGVNLLLMLVLPLGTLLSGWVLVPDHGLRRPAPEMAWYQLELLYRQAAVDVQPLLADGETLAAGDVGVLGFFTNARILDTVGLNSPIATRYYPTDPAFYVTNYAIAPDLIIEQQPKVVVFLEVYGRLGLLQDTRFLADYRLVETIPTNIYGSRGMLVYEREGNK